MEALEKLLKRILIKEPFWGLFLMGLNKRVTTSIPTMAVAKAGINVELLINPSFWETLTDDQRIAVIKHELHHLAFNHLFMGKNFSDKKKFNIAADCEVNCYVENLPSCAVTVKAFNLPSKEGTKYYYSNLPQNVQDQIPDDSSIDDHSNWKDFEDCSETEQTLIEESIKKLLKDVVQQAGKYPASLKDIIEDLFKDKPLVYNWKQHLRRNLIASLKCEFKKTHMRESKRFIDSPGLRMRRKNKILVAIDTSASVSNTELSEFLHEIGHIHKAGNDVHVIECDTVISNEWDYSGQKTVRVTGRGGTEFKPVMDYYFNHKKEYTQLVYFTDGGANLNIKTPSDMLWVITSNGARQNYPGKVIYIPKFN